MKIELVILSKNLFKKYFYRRKITLAKVSTFTSAKMRHYIYPPFPTQKRATKRHIFCRRNFAPLKESSLTGQFCAAKSVFHNNVTKKFTGASLFFPAHFFVAKRYHCRRITFCVAKSVIIDGGTSWLFADAIWLLPPAQYLTFAGAKSLIFCSVMII